MLNQFSILLPEISLTFIALTSQILALFWTKHSRNIAFGTIFVVSMLSLYLLYYIPINDSGFEGTFVNSRLVPILKSIVLGFTVLTLVIYYSYTKLTGEVFKPEFFTLILLSALGTFTAISARDFLLLFCGLELQTLPSYALAAFNQKNSKSSEAGLKYFILSSLMSALMLFGISLIYGFSGSIDFIEVNMRLNENTNLALIIGVILVLTSIMFKLSAAPLHFWTPDVYEGAPISVVTYFAVAQKIAMLFILVTIIDVIVGDYQQIVDLIKVTAILSMIVGVLGAINQHHLKRLMAYSTILNIGYVLIGVYLNSIEGLYSAFLYMLIYIISVMGFFTCLIALLGKQSDDATFDDLKGISTTRKSLAAAIAVIMFSMIGLPPLAGFFAKYYIFYNALAQDELILAMIGIASSVVSAFYYLKIVKYMYFMDAREGFIVISTDRGLLLISAASLTFILFFFLIASNYIL